MGWHVSRYSISFGGLTEQEIIDNGYPYIVYREVDNWIEFSRRTGSLSEWFSDNGLYEEEDFYSDITDYMDLGKSKPETMVEIWAFKDSAMALMFKLTWG